MDEQFDLTPDERYLQSCYLHYKRGAFAAFFDELRYMLPGIIFAGFSLGTNDSTWLWTGFIWVVGCFLLRNCSSRWQTAYMGLIRKYDALVHEQRKKIAELELEQRNN